MGGAVMDYEFTKQYGQNRQTDRLTDWLYCLLYAI